MMQLQSTLDSDKRPSQFWQYMHDWVFTSKQRWQPYRYHLENNFGKRLCSILSSSQRYRGRIKRL